MDNGSENFSIIHCLFRQHDESDGLASESRRVETIVSWIMEMNIRPLSIAHDVNMKKPYESMKLQSSEDVNETWAALCVKTARQITINPLIKIPGSSPSSSNAIVFHGIISIFGPTAKRTED
ncbi:hypothetical protein Trydic_g2289 [Trypoxylus dichotomus]